MSRGLLGIGMLALAAAASAQEATAKLETLCATTLQLPPAALDLERADRDATALQEKGDPRAIELACEGWVAARQRFGERHAETVKWIGNIGIGLFTRQRTDEAMLLLRDSHDRGLALGGDALPLARRAAAVLSMAHIQRQQTADALAWSHRAVDTIEQGAPPTQDSLRLRLNHATLLSMARRNDEARALYAALWDEVKADPERWKAESVGVLHQWAVSERRQARLVEALRINALNIEFQRRWTPENRLGLALATHNQGLLLRALARFDEAEALLHEALQGIRASDAPDLFQAGANIRDTLASLLVERGRPADALALAEEAVALVQASPAAGSGSALRPLRRLAEVQSALGDLTGALQTWRQALAIIESRADAGDAETRILAWLSYARAMLLLGDLGEADRATMRAEGEAAGKPSPPDERAERLRLRAAIAATRGHDEQALRLLADADAAWAELHPTRHPQRVRVAASACWLGQDCEALAQLYDPAWPPDVAAQHALALVAQARRAADRDGAERQARLALQAAHDSSDPSLLWRATAEYARVQADAGRLVEASFFGKRALTLVQTMRENILQGGAQGDETYLRDKLAVYRAVTDWLLAQRRLDEALEVMRLLRRTEQADYGERGTGSGNVLSLTPAEQDLQRLLDRALGAGAGPELQRLRQLARAQRLTTAENQRLQELEREQSARRERALGELDTALAAIRDAAAGPRASASPPGLQRALRADPAPGELRTWLLSTDRELVALFASGQRRWVERRPHGGQVPLEQRIAALHDRLQQRLPTHELQRELHERVGRLIDAAAQTSGSRRVLLWLDGPLRYLPLGLLHDGKRHLAEKLVLALSGGDLVEPGSTPASVAAPRPLRAFGVTRAHQGLPALPAVGDELCGIVNGPVRGLDPLPEGCRDGAQPSGRGPMRGEGDADQRFTEAGLREATHQAGVLHIGTHFVLRPGNVSRSWLMLGDGQRLALQRLRELDLGAPRLVTLSACDTAVPGAGADGREIDGLAATWLAKGAGQVLASLWRVDDRETARFMRRFYAELTRTPGDAAGALHRAQSAAARQGGEVPHWAAFTLLVRR